MDNEITRQCCIDWFTGGIYVYAAADLLLREIRHSDILSSTDKLALTELVSAAMKLQPKCFTNEAWKLVDMLERYAQFADVKGELVAHALR